MDANKELKIDGNPTEKAMIKYFKDSHQVSVMEEQTKLADYVEYCTPFDPKEKYMATCVRKDGGGYRLLIKGAPEQLKVTRQL
jgi:magnesium-transporting ATPase (P-type)